MIRGPSVSLGDRAIGGIAPTLVIAEAGVNHDGDVETAVALIDEAASVGADAVKFQTFRAERVAARAAPKAEYQRRTTGAEGSQLELLRSLELPARSYGALKSRAEERGLLFLSTPFDEESADLLEDIGVVGFKIASGELTNHILLEQVASKRRPMIVSTGMADLGEVGDALRLIEEAGPCPVVLLHCVSEYPARPEDCDLRAMATLRDTYGVPVGFSDHTEGTEVALAAVALGASVIEKHLTLDRSRRGPDHAASLDPTSFRALVRGIRSVESAIGTGVKGPTEGELRMRETIRRSVALRRDVRSGDRIVARDLAALRPGTGIPPARRSEIIGRSARRDLAAGTLLTWDDLS